MSKASLDCISNLENHVHEEFASLRFSGRDFAYSGPKDIFSRIDTYCDDLALEECKTPMMIVGTSGVGKSALLANWMHRRISKTSRIRSGDEYIFWHAVGCSRQSLNVNHMLRRLMTGLKTFFDLEQKQLPVSAEKLSWELPRFLELASKKGKVIILIDGLHRLRNAEDQEDRLSWLPLELPSNVKVMVTVTSNPPNPNASISQSQNKSNKGRILLELERRGVPCLRMPNLDSELCRKLIDSYLRNHTSIDETSKVSGINVLDEARNGLSSASHPLGSAGNSNILKGFLLFETQISQLVAHPLGGNPQFLRLFLRCLDFVCQRGCSIWSVFGNWIEATSVADLVIRILETCEQGHTKTRESSQQACDLTLKAGGLKGLKALYPWHLQLADRDETHDKHVDDKLDGHSQPRHATIHSHDLAQASTHSLAHSHSGTNNKFDKKEAFQIRAGIENKSNQALEQAVESAAQLAVLDTSEVGFNTTNDQLIASIISRIPEERYEENRAVSNNASVKLRNLTQEAGREDSVSSGGEAEDATFDLISAMSSGDEDSDFEVEHRHPTGNNNNNAFPAGTPHSVAGKKSLSDSPRVTGTNSPVPHSAGAGTAIGGHNSHRHSSSSHRQANVSQQQQQQATVSHLATHASDPGDGFFSLPLYMRGGVNTPGLGDVLGSALSLLLVCRHGLKEKELWAILNDLQVLLKAKKLNVERKREKEHEDHLRSSLQGIVNSQGALERVLKSEDIQKRCFLSKDMLLRCVNKFVKLNTADFELLLTYIFKEEIKKEYGLNPIASTSELDFDEIDYESFLINAVKLNRQWRDNHNSTRNQRGQSDLLLENGEEDDDFDDFLLPNHHSHNNNNSNANAQHRGGHRGQSGTTRRSFNNTSNNNNNNNVKRLDGPTDALGPIVEEMLLQILCGLGVLYIPEHKVLVLPSDSEPFREAIQSKYIAPSGENSLLYWHQLIVKHFVSQPNSLRKCEELPWHLKICRKWHLLKDSLVDLTTFDLMFQNDLRDELTDYWLLLTEGPLPLNASSENKNNNNKHNKNNTISNNNTTTIINNNSSTENKDEDGQTTHSALLQEIDEAIACKVPLKEIRRKHRENEMQLFDVVEELNRSVENWVSRCHPPPQEIHDMIERIGRFLLFFSRRTVSCPQYRRTGIEIQHLAEFRVLNDIVQSFAPNIPPLFEEYYETVVRHADETSGHTNHKVATQVLSSDDTEDGNKGKKGGVDRVSRTEKKFFPPKGAETTRFYLFLRWVWVQLPWLALYPAAKLFSSSSEEAAGHETHHHNSSNNNNHNHATHHNIGDEHPHSSAGGGVSVSSNHTSNNDNNNNNINNNNAVVGLGADPSKHLLRVWNVKKADPTVQVFQKSLSRKLAAIKPHSSVSSSMERNVDVSYNKLYEELLQPSHVAQVRLGLGNAPRDKFRRTLEEDIESKKNIPFSYHGVKTMKTGSLFPSYSAFIKEKNQQKVDAEVLLRDDASLTDSVSIGSMSRHSVANHKHSRHNKNDNNNINNKHGNTTLLHSSSAGHLKKHSSSLGKFNLDAALKQTIVSANNNSNNNNNGAFFLTEVDDEIRRMHSEEYLQQHKMDGASLIKDEVDLEHETLLERIARMKTICNKLLIIEREKERNILDLEKQIILREESDTHMINEVQSAEMLLQSLHGRNLAMEQSLQEALELQQGYIALIAALKANPPYIESQVKALEVERELAEQQFNDLCQHRARLHEEVKRLEGMKKQQLIERIQYFQNARVEIQNKKKQVHRELRHLRETLGLRKARAKKLERRNARKAKVNSHNKLGRGGGSPSHNHKNNKRDSDFSSDYDSDDSKASNEDERDIPLNKHVIHFINALVRKSNYNEPIILEGDNTIDDVKKRAAETEAFFQAKRSAATQQATPNGVNGSNSNNNTNTQSSLLSSSLVSGESTTSTSSPHPSKAISEKRNKNNNLSNINNAQSLLANVEARMVASSPNHHQNNVTLNTSNNTNNNNNYNIYSNSTHSNNNTSNHAINPNSMALLAHSKGYVSQKTVLVNRRGRKHSQEQISFLKSLFPSLQGDDKNLMQQLRQAFALLFEKTEFTSIDLFLERYQQDQQMLENLRQQQSVADARLLQLKQEHASLAEEWHDITFAASENNHNNVNNNNNLDETSPSKEDGKNNNDNHTDNNNNNKSPSKLSKNNNNKDNETNDNNNNNTNKQQQQQQQNAQFEDYGRYLDNQLFAKDVQLHHAQRSFDHAVQLLSDIRNAVSHIMTQLSMNHKLLAGLSRHTAPSLQSDADLAQCVSWCEDMIIALNEALTMDAANRPNAAGNNPEDNKSIAERQMELAGLVHDMHFGKRRNHKYRQNNSNSNNNNANNNSNNSNNNTSVNKKEIGGLSKVLIASNDSFVTSPRNVLVTPLGKVDKTYDSKMAKYLAERDRRTGVEHVKDDDNVLFPGEKDSRADAKRFLSQTFDAKSLRRHLHHNDNSNNFNNFNNFNNSNNNDNSLNENSKEKDNKLAVVNNLNNSNSAWTKDIAHRFLTEGLDRDHTRSLSRKAKLLKGHTKGPVAGYGMVLEELMKAHGQTFAFPLAKSPSKMDRIALQPHQQHNNTMSNSSNNTNNINNNNNNDATGGAELDDGNSLSNQS